MKNEWKVCRRAEEEQSVWIVTIVQSVWIVTIVLTCVLSGLAGFLLRNVIPEGMVAPGGQRDRYGVCVRQRCGGIEEVTTFCFSIKKIRREDWRKFTV